MVFGRRKLRFIRYYVIARIVAAVLCYLKNVREKYGNSSPSVTTGIRFSGFGIDGIRLYSKRREFRSVQSGP